MRQTALKGEKDQICAATHTEFAEQIGDVEFYGALGDIELAGDLFVGKIFEQAVEDFLFATAKIGDRVGL